ncbi:MAG: serine hydrolase, partial [Acidimicrobiales bacterium]
MGHAVVRLEDPTLLTGAGKYVDDLEAPNAAHIVFVRSTVAHGKLQGVDVEAAKSMPGVLAVYHSAGDDLGITPFQGFPMLPETFNRPVFATDRVRFVGDIVAAVVAETRPQAVDAAEAVGVDVDPMPVVVTQAAAAAPGGSEQASADTHLRIASMTKMIATVAALQQVEQGNLELDAP